MDESRQQTGAQRCGLVAIVGRPNVGKSTLLNRIVGQKISITSRRPQTTRHRILGIAEVDNSQLIFADTPGWQKRPAGLLNRHLNRQVDLALADVDAIAVVADARYWRPADRDIVAIVKNLPVPRYMVLNKHDKVVPKERLLSVIETVAKTACFDEIVPTCARSGDNVPMLLDVIAKNLPRRPHVFDTDTITDRSERFLAAEFVREKLTRQLGDELPYDAQVIVDRYHEGDSLVEIDATILVNRLSQKKIVIGQGGQRVKQIGAAARRDIETLLGRSVFLRLWVKHDAGWAKKLEATGM